MIAKLTMMVLLPAKKQWQRELLKHKEKKEISRNSANYVVFLEILVYSIGIVKKSLGGQ